MPRKPTDKVIEHRITFGFKERQMIESCLTTWNFKNVATPTVDLLKDVTGLIAFAYLANKLLGLNVDLAGVTDLDELIAAFDAAKWKEQFQTLEPSEGRDERATSLFGGIFNMWDQFSFVLSGGLQNQFGDMFEEQGVDRS